MTRAKHKPNLEGAFFAGRALSHGVGAVALGLVLLAAACESTGFQARRYAGLGQRTADGPNYALTLEWTERALRLDPYNFQALYLRAVKLKEAGRTDELARFLPRVLAAHPNQAAVRRLAGEDAYRREEFGRAADLLWEAMGINPTPPRTPATYWRMTMVAAERAGQYDRSLAAATRALALMDSDDDLGPADRQGLLLNVAEVYARRGWLLSADHLRTVATSIQPF